MIFYHIRRWLLRRKVRNYADELGEFVLDSIEARIVHDELAYLETQHWEQKARRLQLSLRSGVDPMTTDDHWDDSLQSDEHTNERFLNWDGQRIVRHAISEERMKRWAPLFKWMTPLLSLIAAVAALIAAFK